MSKRIKSISFLFEGQRVVLKADRNDTFRLPFESATNSRYSTSPNVYYRNLTARQVIEDRRIKGGDPVLTLENGDKIRVFQSGDPSYLPALSEGVLERHDSLKKEREAQRQAKRVESTKKANANRTTGAFDFDWGYDEDWH